MIVCIRLNIVLNVLEILNKVNTMTKINEFQKYPEDKKKFDENYERIYGKKCPVHRKYKAVFPPRCNCGFCWDIWNERKKK